MNLSMWMIADKLEKYVQRLEIAQGDPTISGVRFFSGDIKEFSPSYVYVGQASEVFSDTDYEKTVLLVHRHDLIFIHSLDIEVILNEILSAFDFYSSWEASLWENSTGASPYQEIFDLCEKVIPYPMRFAAFEGNVVAISKNYGPDDVDARWKHVCETGYIPARIGGPVTTIHGTTQSGWDTKPMEYYFSNGTKYIAAIINADNEAIASIMIWEKGIPFRPHICQLADIVCKVFTSIVEKQDEFSIIRTNASILTDLLEGRELDANAMRLFNGDNRAPWQLLVARNCFSNKELLVKGRILSVIRQLDKTNMSMIYNDDVISVISAARLENFLRNLQDLFQQQYVVGVSLPFSDLTELNLRRNQALFAMEKAEGSPGIYFCEDFAFEHLLSCVKQHNRALELTHPALDILKQYDEAQKTQLYETLFGFLLNERVLVTTAEALFIHRNTLVFRVKRIQNLLNIDLDDPQVRAYLLLSYFLNELK